MNSRLMGFVAGMFMLFMAAPAYAVTTNIMVVGGDAQEISSITLYLPNKEPITAQKSDDQDGGFFIVTEHELPSPFTGEAVITRRDGSKQTISLMKTSSGIIMNLGEGPGIPVQASNEPRSGGIWDTKNDPFNVGWDDEPWLPEGGDISVYLAGGYAVGNTDATVACDTAFCAPDTDATGSLADRGAHIEAGGRVGIGALFAQQAAFIQFALGYDFARQIKQLNGDLHPGGGNDVDVLRRRGIYGLVALGTQLASFNTVSVDVMVGAMIVRNLTRARVDEAGTIVSGTLNQTNIQPYLALALISGPLRLALAATRQPADEVNFNSSFGGVAPYQASWDASWRFMFQLGFAVNLLAGGR